MSFIMVRVLRGWSLFRLTVKVLAFQSLRLISFHCYQKKHLLRLTLFMLSCQRFNPLRPSLVGYCCTFFERIDLVNQEQEALLRFKLCNEAINREFWSLHRQVTNDVFVLPNKQFYFGCSYVFQVSNFVEHLSTVKQMSNTKPCMIYIFSPWFADIDFPSRWVFNVGNFRHSRYADRKSVV